jgi:MYXO-CTERM domain-containing protein
MVLSGLLWAAQGSGLFPYPEQSFMIDSRPWIGWGLLMALAGLVVIWLGRRRPG